jgi:hypothetical protein
MSTMNQCKVMKDGNGDPTGVIILPRAKMLYPALFKAHAQKNDPPDKAKFGTSILIPKDANLQPVIDAVNKLIADKLGAAAKTTKVRKPFLKVTEEDQPKIVARLQAADIDPAGFPIMLRCLTKQRPTVKSADMSEVTDETMAYDGRWCRVSVRPYFYDHPTGGKGVSLGMNNVQLLDEDDVIPRIGGSNADDEFEAVGSDDPFA